MGKKRTSVLRESQCILTESRRSFAVHSLQNATVLKRCFAIELHGWKKNENKHVYFSRQDNIYTYMYKRNNIYYYNINNDIGV